MLPYEPENIEALRTRYRAALTAIFDCRDGMPRPRPGELRGHVFDCEDGLRLIISRDRESDSELYLHLSASFTPGTELYKQLQRGRLTKQEFIQLARARFSEISGDDGHFELLGFSAGKGVPHWRRLEGN